MASDASSNRPRPVRAGAAPTTAGGPPVGERFDVALTLADAEGRAWQVRVGGRALAGRPQAGRGVDSVPELLLLLFTRDGGETPELEALVSAATVRGPDGGLAVEAVRSALERARPFQGRAPEDADFFEGTRQRRGR